MRRRKLGRTSCREVAKLSRLSVHRNDRGVLPEVDFLFRWGCTSRQPAKHTINTVEAISLVNNKLEFRKVAGSLCPKTWFDVNIEGDFPLILRPSTHAQGRNLHFCRDSDSLNYWSNYYKSIGKEYYISEYIQKEKEYRVFVVQGRVVWVTEKTPANPNDIAWNVARGGRFDNVRWNDWPLKVCRIAVEAYNLIPGASFLGIDVMTKGNDVYVLEANSAPSMTSPYRQESTAKAFKWIVDNGKENIPLVNKIGGYKKFIHPAVSENAWV